MAQKKSSKPAVLLHSKTAATATPLRSQPKPSAMKVPTSRPAVPNSRPVVPPNKAAKVSVPVTVPTRVYDDETTKIFVEPRGFVTRCIVEEEARLCEILAAVERANLDWYQTISNFEQKIDEIQQEKLNEQHIMKKAQLDKKLRELQTYDPRKYKEQFKYGTAPYFAAFSIDDEKIGKRTYLLGKQALFDASKVVVVDWRSAAVSRLFYEYEAGEDYSEEINNQDREGLLVEKRKLQIDAKLLSRLIRERAIPAEGCDAQLRHSTWVELRDGKPEDNLQPQARPTGPAQVQPVLPTLPEEKPAEKKRPKLPPPSLLLSTPPANVPAPSHYLKEIVALISREQFSEITKQHSGCLYLTGGAGSGKTTVAIHRLSFLRFNFPEKFEEDRCLLVMFNRGLKEYIRPSAHELLGEKVQVETYTAWASRALRVLVPGLRFQLEAEPTNVPKPITLVKRDRRILPVLEAFIARTKKTSDELHLLRRFFQEADSIAEAMPKVSRETKRQLKDLSCFYRKAQTGTDGVSYADLGLMLYMFQKKMRLHSATASFSAALNWYQHIVVDEAQDLSPAELETLRFACTKELSMTICADINQQILWSSDFSVDAFKISLGKSFDSGTMSVSYRSTANIMQYACRVLQAESPACMRKGAAVREIIHPALAQLDEELVRTLLNEQARHPNQVTALICKTKPEVKQLSAKLQKAKIEHSTDILKFSFKSGILVTNAHQVKGLEFASVVVWMPSATKYKAASKTDQNLLYVVLTRASDRLTVICTPDRSELLHESRSHQK